ncbi:ABC transporter permease [Xinfangfangia sp. CPCC 101601]|uniref:ABC transporter permease n=1 Tax=Pseudogemmobacter lacusdianii TaxID=3069608 RepID=A0ABU0VSS7_9RHOB|nr:ABC transporter permease [Xinfangfangia sp. CPCC 101601]MDQ2064773.1 ABC transporter permease [Xinfangfangia sp. CPCC 101601]
MAEPSTLRDATAPVEPRQGGAFARWLDRRGWSDILIGGPYIWLLLLFLVPFLIVVAMSVATKTSTAPPISWGGEVPLLNWEPYQRVLSDGLYLRAFLTSVMNAGIAMILCLFIGYPMALGLVRVAPSWRNILLMLVILPFWTSFLLRVYAWMGLMGRNSWFNGMLTDAWNFLVPIDWAVRSIPMMNSNFAVVLVMVYTYLPFMILPLYASLERLDTTLDEAAMDLGSRPARVFWDVTLPQSVPGIIAGGMLVFIPAAGELVIPSLVGNASSPMIGRLISDEFSMARDWPMASAIAVMLLLLMVVPTMLYSHYQAKAGGSK